MIDATSPKNKIIAEAAKWITPRPRIKERPIIFSVPMVRAILEGRKTQMRRVINPQPADDALLPREWGKVFRRRNQPDIYGGDGTRCGNVPLADGGWGEIYCPHGAPGDRLWVREAFARVPATAYHCSTGVDQTADPGDPDMCAVYREGWKRSSPGGWRSPVLMPRWASRITLEITDIRVERLQGIIEGDAIAEGATMRPSCSGFRHAHPGWSMDWSRVGEFSRFAAGAQHGQKAPLTEGDISLSTARLAFANFFNRIHGPNSWDASPWVWVIEFIKLEATK